jgi:hypothetical protein
MFVTTVARDIGSKLETGNWKLGKGENAPGRGVGVMLPFDRLRVNELRVAGCAPAAQV